MKNIVMFIAALIAAFSLSAQSFDGGFEQFQTKDLYEQPSQFKNSNAYTFPVDNNVNVTKVPDLSGGLGVRLTNVVNDCGTVPGVLILGGFGPNGVETYPMDKEPTAVEFQVKTSPGYSSVLDSAKFIAIQFGGGEIARVAGGLENISNSPLGRTLTYNFLELPDGPGFVDSILIVAVSSVKQNPDAGEWIELYNYRLIGSEIGVTDTLPNQSFSQFEVLDFLDVTNGWNSDNVYHYSATEEYTVQQTSDAYEGNFAATITTRLTAASEFNVDFDLSEIADIDDVAFDTNDFIDTVGTLFSGNYTGCREFTDGIQLSAYPTSLNGFYKYRSGENGGTGDEALFTLIFMNDGQESFRNEFTLPEASAYTEFSLPITPNLSFAPEEVFIVAQASDFRDTVKVEIGSQLTLDAMEFVIEENVDAGEDQVLCEFSPIQIGGEPTYTGGASTISYAWEPAELLVDPTAANPTLKNNVFDEELAVLFGVTVSADGAQLVDQVLVTLAASVEIPFQLNGLCLGEEETLNALQFAEIEVAETPTYSWNINGMTYSGIEATFPVQAANTISLTVEVAGCTYESSNTIVGTDLSVDAGDDIIACIGELFTLSATSTPVATTYAWGPPTGLTSPFSASTTQEAVASETYTIEAYLRGCLATDQVIVAVVNPQPGTISITPEEIDGPLCIGQAAILSVDVDYAEYNWSTGDNTPTSTISVTSNVDVLLSAVDINECEIDLTFNESYSACVGLEVIKNNIQVYPNPSKTTFTIEQVPANAVVSVYSVTGALQYQSIPAYTTNLQFGSDFNAGVFILTIETEEGISTSSIIKE